MMEKNMTPEDEMLQKLGRYLELYGRWIDSGIDADLGPDEASSIEDFLQGRICDLFDTLITMQAEYEA